MTSDETMSQIFTRFTTITNGLNILDRSYSSVELVNKVLKSLPKAYQSNVGKNL